MKDSYNLKPTVQKSYYGKAKVMVTANGASLKSYDTIVCKIEDGQFVRLWGGYSVTTMKHINDFRILYGLPKLTKAEWLSIPAEDGRPVYRVRMVSAFGTAYSMTAQLDREAAERLGNEAINDRAAWHYRLVKA